MKTRYLIPLIAAATLFVGIPHALAAGEFAVQLENYPHPMFEKADFAPGNTETRWIQVASLVSLEGMAAIRVDDLKESGDMASMLDVEVREGADIRFTGTLRELYDAGVTDLSSVPAHTTVRYDMSVTFDPAAGDEYQDATVNFNIAVGIHGEGDSFQTFSDRDGPSGSYVVTPPPSPEDGVGGFNEPTPPPAVSGNPAAGGETGLLVGTSVPTSSPSPSPSPAPNRLLAAIGLLGGSGICTDTGRWAWLISAIVLLLLIAWFGRRKGWALWALFGAAVVWTLWAALLCSFSVWWLAVLLAVIAYAAIWLLKKPEQIS